MQPASEQPPATDVSGKEEKKEETADEKKEEEEKKGEEEKKDDEKENPDKDKKEDEESGNKKDDEDGEKEKETADGETAEGEKEEQGEEKQEVKQIPVDFYYNYDELMSRARVTEGSGLPNDLLTLQYPFEFDYASPVHDSIDVHSRESPHDYVLYPIFSAVLPQVFFTMLI